MSDPEATIKERLEAVEDPELGEDIVSLDIVRGVSVEGETATVDLAFNTPYAPEEAEIGAEIRDILEAEGYEAELNPVVTDDLDVTNDLIPNVRNIIAVASGKGGVGKTTVAANLAAGLEKRGAVVGLLDADIHGPNIPRVLPTDEEPGVTEEELLVPPTSDGVRLMSMGYLIENQDDPAIMRGPMVNKVMTHFFENVEWGYLDYLIIDLPPGTGDASLDLLQTLPIAGTVIVTTPQQMAVDDARKGLKLFQKYDTPVLGVVENMSSFICPSCEDVHDPFGTDGAEQIREEYDVDILGKVPVHPDFGADGTEGPLVKDEDSPVQEQTEAVVTATLDRLAEVNRRKIAGRETWLGEDDSDEDDPAVATVGGDPDAADRPDRPSDGE